MSLFAVVFAMLLITIVTVSFVRIMVGDQQQASDTDLSQSAYDSSQAGVEDAKRALLRYREACVTGTQAECDGLAAQLADNQCNVALRVGGVVAVADDGTNTGEVRVQQSVGDVVLDQAYTCVTMKLRTDDYLGSRSAGSSQLVPLVGASTFNEVTIEWFTRDDISSSTTAVLDLPGASTSQPLYQQTSWPVNRPSVLRAQLMQFGSSFTMGSFDATVAGQSNANTVFLYPSASGVSGTDSFTVRDIRRSNPTGTSPADSRTDTPLPVTCSPNLAAGGYACKLTLQLPDPIGGGARNAFLRVTPLYNATHFRVSLSQSGTLVQFKDVQPEVDSTGRANDIFRRVLSRVDLYDTTFPYPEAAVDLTGNFCKDFAVTDTQYIAGSCTP